MPISVLVVDDSAFFVNQIVAIINKHPALTVIGTASNGRDAIAKAKKLKPDVITMDYEMPVMDGITSIKEIMKVSPTAILMFSSLTFAGARITLDALDAGAVDFLPKYREEVQGSNQLQTTLCAKIVAVANSNKRVRSAPVSAPKAPVRRSARKVSRPDIVLIGTSTGGPVALQKVLVKLPANLPVPILVIQHMPGTFTGPFSERLDHLCGLSIKEAENNDTLKPGHVYVAPGGMQMMISGRSRLKVMAGDDRLNYKPSVDLTFGSAVNHYRGKALAIVMTGMGSDGTEGARLLKAVGCSVWIQDSASCVIDGMPSSVAKAGYSDDVIRLEDIASRISELF